MLSRYVVDELPLPDGMVCSVRLLEHASALTAIRESEIMPASVIVNVAGPSVDQIAAELSAAVFNDPVVLPSERKAARLTLERLSAVSLKSGK